MRSIRFLAAAALVAVGAIPAAVLTTAPAAHATTPTTYYVDCSVATDGSGTQASPWNSLADVSAHTFGPGDQLLFNRGTSCAGRVQLQGSGTASAPISVDAYGTGALPKLLGDGTWATVTLYNQQYWDFADLDVTNNGPTITQSDPTLIADQDRRRGFYIHLQDYGTGSHYHFTNLNIHDVNGPRGWNNTTTGAIFFEVTGTTTPTHFNDVLVQNSTFTSDDFFALNNWTTWADRPQLPASISGAPWAAGPWQPATNFVVRNNTLNDLGADGIQTNHTIGALVEHNVVTSYQTRDTARCHVPLFDWNADDAVFQYNEVYGGQGTCDGTAFDFDGGNTRNIVQYNYDHDNKGGFLTVCSAGTSADNVARYNISQNDGTRLFQVVCGTETNNQVYNNTFYLGSLAAGPMQVVQNFNSSGASSLSFTNNIFDVSSSLASQVSYSGASALTWNSNTFFGAHPSSEPADPNKLTSDPLFGSPGTGPTGYILGAGSPDLQSGSIIPTNGGNDYRGHAVPTSCPPDRGAMQTTVTSPSCSSDLALGKTATQSSTRSGGDAGHAVDGNTDGAFGDGSVTHTNDNPIDNNPWWQVDLGSSQNVSTVQLWNRTDCCGTRLSNFYVFASNSPFTSTDPTTTAGQSGVRSYQQSTAVGTDQSIPIGITARYIRVQLVGNSNPLSLAEVQVFGNEAVGGTASGDATCPPSQTAPNAVDGNTSTKWCAPGNNGVHQLTVKLPQAGTISTFTILHAGSAGEPANLNTRNFTISTTTDAACSSGWTQQVSVTGNTANVTTNSITPTWAACVQLNITVPSINDGATAARIYELEAY